MAVYSGSVSLKLKDWNGNECSMPVKMKFEDTSTIAQLITDAKALATTTDVIIGAQIMGATVAVDITTIAGLKTAPDAGSDINQTATFNFTQNAIPNAAPIVVPSISDNVVVGGAVDLTNADVQAFIDFLLAVGVAVTWVSNVLNALLAILDALFSFRKRSKAVNRRSFP